MNEGDEILIQSDETILIAIEWFVYYNFN